MCVLMGRKGGREKKRASMLLAEMCAPAFHVFLICTRGKTASAENEREESQNPTLLPPQSTTVKSMSSEDHHDGRNHIVRTNLAERALQWRS